MPHVVAEGDICGSGLKDFMSDDAGKIKGAAAAILKGGTLVSEQCIKCGGVQVRFEGKTKCINCGEENNDERKKQKIASTDSVTIIEGRVDELVSELAGEKDLTIQRQKAELLEIYLNIIKLMRDLAS